MRKSKEIKRMRIDAGLEYKRGNRPEAYEAWVEAKKQMDELRGRNKPAAGSQESPAKPASE